jgi:hypothetical protein
MFGVTACQERMPMDKPPSPAEDEVTEVSAGPARAASPSPTRTARWKAVVGSAVLAVGVFTVGYGCTGGSAPVAAKPGPPVTITSQTPEPPTAVGTPPADRTKPSTAACATRRRPAGWTRTENARPGDSSWRAGFDADTSIVAGYLDQVSAACGDTLGLHLSGYVSSASVTAYRMGWYGGAGGRCGVRRRCR